MCFQVIRLVEEGVQRNAHLEELYIKLIVTGTSQSLFDSSSQVIITSDLGGVAQDGKALEPGESSFFITFGPASPTPDVYYTEVASNDNLC